MSFRHPFVTDFIYQGGDDVKNANAKITAAFKERGITLFQEVDPQRGLGFYCGMIRTSSLGCELSEMELEPLIAGLEMATKVPFRLTIMQESGAVITYPIEPRR